MIVGIFIYFKIKVFVSKEMKKEFESKFCTDDELNDMLDRLW